VTVGLSAGQVPDKPSPWPRRILRLGLIWAAILVVLMGAQRGASPEDRTTALSIALSGLYTVLLYRTRRRWLPRLASHPLRNAMILGSVNAAIIETVFLVVEKLMGVQGVAASPNLIVDLLLTMPWYIGMVILFVKVQHRRRFAPSIVLLLGGVYEIGADGLVGGGFSGELITPAALVLFPLVFLWLFIPVYSSMVLPPAWLVETIPPAPTPSTPAWRDAVRPLLWLAPFVVYLVLFLVVAGAMSAI